MPPTSDERALATVLAERDDAELAELLDARGVAATVGWRDLFDMAAALLDPTSVARGLASLPRPEAVALADAAAAASVVSGQVQRRLVAAALVDADGRPFGAAVTAVNDREAPAPVRRADRGTTAADDAQAAERAYTSAASLADLLLHTLAHPLTRIGSGALGAADRRGLVDEGSVADADSADLLVDLAATAGLLRADDRFYLVTTAGRDWVSSSTVERWSLAAVRLRDAMPPGLRTPEGGWIPAAHWDGAYPFDTAWPTRAALWRGFAVAWGIITPGGGEPPWAAGLAAGGDADLDALRSFLPPEVDRVYLQNDLTAIAPGPLAPHLDVRLRSMARRESRAQASSYRFSADTLTAAITAGETAESVREFLRTLSLTGIPQPLEYVLSRSADRRGTLRVGRTSEGRTRVTSDDPTVLETVAVDQALRALGLVPNGDELSSRVAPETVFWALADAKYPVTAVDEDGASRAVDRSRIAEASDAPSPLERYGELLTRLRAGSASDDADAAWLERELDQAVRARAVVDVVVRLPDGSDRTFRLEATGLGGGRLRGRDRGADVERTLPLSSIASVHPVA
ncbi:helicase-associated domain-containing protein [Microbacterium sp. NPDC091313]